MPSRYPSLKRWVRPLVAPDVGAPAGTGFDLQRGADEDGALPHAPAGRDPARLPGVRCYDEDTAWPRPADRAVA
jgi:hypothetical protein